jgi:hypothetical protein
MTVLSHFFLHTAGGRILLVGLVLILALVFVSIVGWLPALH